MKPMKRPLQALAAYSAIMIFCGLWSHARAQTIGSEHVAVLSVEPRQNALSDREKYLLRALVELHYAQNGQHLAPNRENFASIMKAIGARHDEAEWVWQRLRRHKNFDDLLVRTHQELTLIEKLASSPPVLRSGI